MNCYFEILKLLVQGGKTSFVKSGVYIMDKDTPLQLFVVAHAYNFTV